MDETKSTRSIPVLISSNKIEKGNFVLDCAYNKDNK